MNESTETYEASWTSSIFVDLDLICIFPLAFWRLQALQFNWINCGADSIFVPGTQKNELVR